MKIVHLALEAPYNEGWGYQENLLTKYQAKAGHDVTLIITNRENSPNGKEKTVPLEDYISPDGFRVIRLDYIHFKPNKISNVFRIYKIYHLLCSIAPDFIMVHGLNNFSVLQAIKYINKVNPACKIIADNHLDYNIGRFLTTKKFTTRIYKAVLRLLNQRTQKYYSKIFGVTPWRCEFCEDIYGIKKEKLDVLPAGADDEKIDFNNREKISADIREKHNIEKDDFLIVTGGKIDKNKNIDTLMKAVINLPDKNIKLIVFGNPSPDIKQTLKELAKNDKIKYIGWISSDDTYNYFLAADLVFFPGQHSVMWEQCVACGTPLVMKHFHAMHHCDIGGNSKFLYDASEQGISNLIREILEPQVLNKMRKIALSEKRQNFLYSKLAEQTLDVLKEETNK